MRKNNPAAFRDIHNDGTSRSVHQEKETIAQQRARQHFEGSTEKQLYGGTGLDLSKSLGGGGGGDPQRTASGRIRTRFPITMARDVLGNTTIREKLAGLTDAADSADSQEASGRGGYFPFGKPGAGAPLRSGDGKISPRLKGTLQFEGSTDTRIMRRRAADTYLAVLKSEIVEKENRDRQILQESQREAETLADVIRRGRVGNPRRDPYTGLLQNQHNPTSDVTKYKTGRSQTPPRSVAQDYHADLVRLADERHRSRQIDKLRDKYEEVKHEKHWTEYWGKPGAGAPLQRPHYGSHKKGNLNNMLFGVQSADDAQIKSTRHGPQEAHLDAHRHLGHVISGRTAVSQPDVSHQRHTTDPRSYSLRAPFATYEALVENGA